MTIFEALARIDNLKPNNYTSEDKIGWLSELDGRVKAEIIDTHEGGDSVVFNGYDASTDTTTEMLIPSPYDDVYVKWLESKIDYTNAEYGKYNNSSAAFNEVYAAFDRYYNRQHLPKQVKLKFF